MDRRRFIRTGTAGALGTSAVLRLAAPALAQNAPKLRWRCASSFPRLLDTVFGGAEDLARHVREATNGDFEIEVLAAGEAVPALQAADAVLGNTVEMCHTATHYYAGKDPTWALGASIPFALNARALNAWLHSGGGIDLLNEFFNAQGLHYLPGGNTGTQMGGWFRREINSVQDFRGLKMRIAGLAGPVMGKLGAVPQQIAADEIYPALERGTVDAAEWAGPYDDEKLGLAKLAPFYYYPGWWEGSLALSFLVAKPAFDALPASYRSILTTASRAVTVEMLAKYDFLNPPAFKRLVAAGAQPRPFPQDVLNACFDAANQVYSEIGGGNAPFRKVFDSMMAFRADTYLYQQVPEYTFDTFMMIKQREGALGGR
jgi:TRAP-type mannitol/chloroaromatic compound transport system substrate-binding protein